MQFFGRSQPAAYQALDVQSYNANYVQNDTDHVLVDVRTVGEFMGGHVPHAINIPLHEFSSRASELPQDKPIIVICATGNRSRSACSFLANAGRKDVYNLNGGTFAWMTAGLPLE